MHKLKVAVVFGGRSGEHEISILSAKAILSNLDPSKYAVTPLYVSREGQWLPPEIAQKQLAASNVKELTTSGFPVEKSLSLTLDGASSSSFFNSAFLSKTTFDIVFPVIHGTFGEDGTIQGLLEMANIPYVGAGVLASSLGMDKSLMKSCCASFGLPVLPAYTLLRSKWNSLALQPEKRDALAESIEEITGYPAFVKPCNLGSSVGISKVRNRQELIQGITSACRFDRKILIEKGLNSPRELELAVLGNDDPKVSLPGEIIHGGDFYDYATKYFETKDQKIVIPAEIPEHIISKLQTLALKTYQALDLNGLSRIDFLLDPSNEESLYLNEVNTMPGFTSISMYSMLWKASGLAYGELLDELVKLGIERHRDQNSNETID